MSPATHGTALPYPTVPHNWAQWTPVVDGFLGTLQVAGGVVIMAGSVVVVVGATGLAVGTGGTGIVVALAVAYPGVKGFYFGFRSTLQGIDRIAGEKITPSLPSVPPGL